MIQFLVAHPPIAAAIWAVMDIFDHGATLWFARKYQQNPNRYITFEGGVELNPVFEFYTNPSPRSFNETQRPWPMTR
jgi:hypothetical protein